MKSPLDNMDFYDWYEYENDVQGTSDEVIEFAEEKYRDLENSRGICTWCNDEDGNWHTDCKQIHTFLEGGPGDNHYNFCPYCGKVLEEWYREDKEDV